MAATSQPASQPTSMAAASQPAASQPAVEASGKDKGEAPEPPAFARIREYFTKAGVSVQNVVQPGRAEDNRYEVILGGLADEMRKIFGPGVVADVPQVESVGPKMGEQLRNDGIKAVLASLALILVYVAFRFDFRFAPGAVVALAHDVIITTGVFAVLWIEFSLPVLAAMLTIAGYSINDTIVIYDRIRENVARLRDRKFSLVVNASLNETLGRTICTSLTTLYTSLAVYAFSAGAVRNFALALSFGVVIGTYSTIFIASPFTIFLNERWAKRAAKAR
jgi:preprotein translocase subunit SecF